MTMLLVKLRPTRLCWCCGYIETRSKVYHIITVWLQRVQWRFSVPRQIRSYSRRSRSHPGPARPSLPAALTVPDQSGTFWFTSDPATVWPEDDRVSFKTIIGAVWPVIRHCSPAGLRAWPGHRLKCACLLPPQWQPNGPCLLASSMSSSAVYCRTCTSPRLSFPLLSTVLNSLPL